MIPVQKKPSTLAMDGGNMDRGSKQLHVWSNPAKKASGEITIFTLGSVYLTKAEPQPYIVIVFSLNFKNMKRK